MRRALALVALSLFVSLVLTAVATILSRPDARGTVREAVSRLRLDEPGEEVPA